MEGNNKEFKLVFNAGICRRLIKMGIPVADIKADKNNPDKTVFVFKNDDAFKAAFGEINEGIKASVDKETL